MTEKNIVKLAIVVHIGNKKIWEDMSVHVPKSKIPGLSIDYYFYLVQTLVEPDLGKKLKADYPGCAVKMCENKGMDCGSFLLFMKEVFEKKKIYNYVLKLHTKTREAWRQALLRPLLLNDNLKRNIKLMESDKNIGSVGSQAWVLPGVHGRKTIEECEKYVKLIYDAKNTPQEKRIKNIYRDKGDASRRLVAPLSFVGGTMFMIRFSILKNNFGKVNLQQWFNEQPLGRTSDGKAHALERIFGVIVFLDNQKVFGVKAS